MEYTGWVMEAEMVAQNLGTCLVLSGGGAKGVYHVGAWRALRQLGIKVDAFVGSSIGAIIAAFLAQDADDALEEIGRTLAMDSILELPSELTQQGELKIEAGVLAKVRSIFTKVMENKGLDTSPLRQLLQTKLNESTIRAGGKDLGVVTVNVTQLQAMELFIDQMQPGLLIDYLMASAAFPGFERTEVDGKHFLDGGLYDNVPYAMARARGYNKIIVIDISGIGRTRKINIEGTNTTYIHNSITMGGVLDFDKKFLTQYLELGYLDTLKTYGEIQGYRYFITGSDSTIEEQYRANFTKIAPTTKWPSTMRYDQRYSLKFLDCMATSLDLERIRQYTMAELLIAIRSALAGENQKLTGFLAKQEGKKTGLTAKIAKAIELRELDASPYFYYQLIQHYLPGKAGDVLQSALAKMVPELDAGLAGLSIIAG